MTKKNDHLRNIQIELFYEQVNALEAEEKELQEQSEQKQINPPSSEEQAD